MRTYTLEHVREWIDQHDEMELAGLEIYVTEQPWGNQSMELMRLVAQYADQRGNYHRSCGLFKRMLVCAEADANQQAVLLLDICELQDRWRLRFTDELTSVQSILVSSADPALQARLLRCQALQDSKYGDISGGRAAARRALEMERTLHDRKGQADSLNTLARVELSAGRYREALYFTRQVLGNLLPVMGEKSRAEALSLHAYGIEHSSPNRNEVALRLYESALEIHRKRRDPLETYRTCSAMESLLTQAGEYRRALDIWREGFEALQRTQPVQPSELTEPPRMPDTG